MANKVTKQGQSQIMSCWKNLEPIWPEKQTKLECMIPSAPLPFYPWKHNFNSSTLTLAVCSFKMNTKNHFQLRLIKTHPRCKSEYLIDGISFEYFQASSQVVWAAKWLEIGLGWHQWRERHRRRGGHQSRAEATGETDSFLCCSGDTHLCANMDVKIGIKWLQNRKYKKCRHNCAKV